MAKVAFIGLGNMGSGMAERLLTAGHELCVFNRSALKAEALVKLGARRCATPAEAAAGASAVFSMLADDEASRAIWTGERGVLSANLAPGTLAVECSTLS